MDTKFNFAQLALSKFEELTGFERVIGFESAPHLLAAAEDEHHAWTFAYDHLRLIRFAAQLVIELVVGVRRLLSFCVNLQIALGATTVRIKLEDWMQTSTAILTLL